MSSFFILYYHLTGDDAVSMGIKPEDLSDDVFDYIFLRKQKDVAYPTDCAIAQEKLDEMRWVVRVLFVCSCCSPVCVRVVLLGFGHDEINFSVIPDLTPCTRIICRYFLNPNQSSRLTCTVVRMYLTRARGAMLVTFSFVLILR
jgi:hypothetical protein